MYREKNIRQEIKPFLEALIRLYETTDPEKGEESEFGKIANARKAFSLWWYLYGKLMLWAQAQITGFEVAQSNRDFIDVLMDIKGGNIYEDSHELEKLGLCWPYNPPPECRDEIDKLSKLFEQEGITAYIPNEIMRNIIVQIHLSTDANSSYWRFPLSRALRASNYGELDPLLEPSKKGRRGQPYSLAWQRAAAIAHIYYRLGQGLKKYLAIQQVEDEIAVSPETLRDWEKELKKDGWFLYEWQMAFLAAKLENEVDDNLKTEILDEYWPETGGWGRDEIVARHFLETKDGSRSLAVIKAKIREFSQRAEHLGDNE